jgi:hypothetical protein
MSMKKPWDVIGDKMMKTAGDKAKRGIDNFMEAFQDYEIETIVANLEAGGEGNTPQLKIALQIKMKKKP